MRGSARCWRCRRHIGTRQLRLHGAWGGTRTLMALRPADFKSDASTGFATQACAESLARCTRGAPLDSPAGGALAPNAPSRWSVRRQAGSYERHDPQEAPWRRSSAHSLGATVKAGVMPRPRRGQSAAWMPPISLHGCTCGVSPARPGRRARMRRAFKEKPRRSGV